MLTALERIWKLIHIVRGLEKEILTTGGAQGYDSAYSIRCAGASRRACSSAATILSCVHPSALVVPTAVCKIHCASTDQ